MAGSTEGRGRLLRWSACAGLAACWAGPAAGASLPGGVVQKKLPGIVNPAATSNGEGYFAIVGDWGNPFSPGMNDMMGATAYWGPHWRCNSKRGQPHPERCSVGSAAWDRDEFAQINISKAMTEYARRHKVQFVVNLGDSLYPAGFDSPQDIRWQLVFEDRYPDEALQVPWLSVLGNHDWGGFDCYWGDNRLIRADAQIGYDTEHDWQWPQSKASRWVMPHWYYKKRITFGETTMDFFAIENNWVDEAEMCGELPYAQYRCEAVSCRAYLRKMADECLTFLQTELPASDADWKIVVGHRPINELAWWLTDELNIVDLMRRNNVSLYITGHRHTLEHNWLTPVQGPPWVQDGPPRPGAVLEVVSGAGGGAYSDGPQPGLSLWGFNGVKVTKQSLLVDYVSDSGELLTTVEVPRPCAQLWGNACAWSVSPWQPAEPCCDGTTAAGACTQTTRTREAHCTGGPAERCSGSPAPETVQHCSAMAREGVEDEPLGAAAPLDATAAPGEPLSSEPALLVGDAPSANATRGNGTAAPVLLQAAASPEGHGPDWWRLASIFSAAAVAGLVLAVALQRSAARRGKGNADPDGAAPCSAPQTSGAAALGEAQGTNAPGREVCQPAAQPAPPGSSKGPLGEAGGAVPVVHEVYV